MICDLGDPMSLRHPRRVFIFLCIYPCVCVCIHVCMCVSVCVCVYPCVYVCIRVCMWYMCHRETFFLLHTYPCNRKLCASVREVRMYLCIHVSLYVYATTHIYKEILFLTPQSPCTHKKTRCGARGMHRVVKTHMMPYLSRSFSAKEPYN